MNCFYLSSTNSTLLQTLTDCHLGSLFWSPTSSFHLSGFCSWSVQMAPDPQSLSWPSQLGVQFSSVAQSCPTLCNPMNHSTPGLPVHHPLLEFTQTHVHWVGDAIQPSHPLLSPSPPTFNLSQHQGLFKWVSSSYQVAKDWSFSFNISPSNEYSWLISFRIDNLVEEKRHLGQSGKPAWRRGWTGA